MPTATLKIPATYMRGGTSKGVFFNLADLPPAAQLAGAQRDALLLRVIGSPDSYGKQIDGMGGASSSTSKVALISTSSVPEHDVDYLFGQVSIDAPVIDWSGNCGNLTSAVASFAIDQGLLPEGRVPEFGLCTVRIWQANIGKTIVAHVPIYQGRVQEIGDFELDGVTFPAAELQLTFVDPAPEADTDATHSAGGLFPTGALIDELVVPNIGTFEATLINAGIPTIFINAADLGYSGCELQEPLNSNASALATIESIRAHGALKMGLIEHISEAVHRQHTPKIALVAPPANYTTANGKAIQREHIDVLVRAFSMGKLHHAMMGTAAVAIGAAAAIPGTLINRAAGGGTRDSVCFGHPSGTLRVGAQAVYEHEQWHIKQATMSRSARVLMSGWVHVPAPA